MSNVTIRGRISTTTIGRDEVRTVLRTEQVDRLVAGGYVEIVGEEINEAPSSIPVVEEGPEDYDVAVPPKSATKAEWAEFLQSQDITTPADATKDDLIEAWSAQGAGNA